MARSYEENFDPRPDLAGDSAAWSGLLQATYIRDGEDPAGLYGVLHGLRCLGARLEPWRGGIRLTNGELDRAEYEDLRGRYLAPFRDVLIPLLRQAA